MSRLDLIIATTNAHKLREMRQILVGLEGFDLLSLHAFPNYEEPKEIYTTFEENAKLKAETAARQLGFLSLAEDSGLIVPALDGRPGVKSARFAGEKATDADNRRKLLQEMKHLTGLQRSAFFVCHSALASPDGLIAMTKGICEGIILEEERGGGGFGYDPLFLKLDYNKTLAELGERIKNQISHRYKALSKLRIHLDRLTSSGGHRVT